MARDTAERWVRGVCSDDAVSGVARRTLKQRLAAVRHVLPLAAKKADEDVEYVHELRVATRRATAALNLYAELLPRRKAAHLARQLKRIRRAAGDARDCDVLALQLAEEDTAEFRRYLAEVCKRRRAAQRSFRKAYRRAKKGGHFDRRVKVLLRAIRRRRDDTLFRDWAGLRLRPVAQKLFAAAPAGDARARELHRFRIRVKKMRYALELLAAAFPRSAAENLDAAVKAAQQTLGEVTDAAAADRRIQDWLRRVDDPAEANGLRKLLARERDRLERTRRDFLRWWTPQRLAELQARFDALLAGGRSLATA